MSIEITNILSLQPPISLESSITEGLFQQIYVAVAEAIATSRDALSSAVEPMDDTDNYNGTFLSGNIRTIADIQHDIGFIEENISEISFVLRTLRPAIKSFSQISTVSSDSFYLGCVTALNNFVEDNVLGVETENSNSVEGKYQETLQLFIEIDCSWTEGSAPQTWLDLCTAAGFTVQ